MRPAAAGYLPTPKPGPPSIPTPHPNEIQHALYGGDFFPKSSNLSRRPLRDLSQGSPPPSAKSGCGGRPGLAADACSRRRCRPADPPPLSCSPTCRHATRHRKLHSLHRQSSVSGLTTTETTTPTAKMNGLIILIGRMCCKTLHRLLWLPAWVLGR